MNSAETCSVTTPFVIILPILLVTLLTSQAFAGEPATKTSKPVNSAVLLTDELSNSDPAVQDAALAKIRKSLSTLPESSDVIGGSKSGFRVFPGWPTALIKVRRYQDAAELSLEGTVQYPIDLPTLAAFQKSRVLALLRAEQYEAALSAAKSYYNVCPVKDSAAAIDLLSLCLTNARPNDRDIARQFEMQQVTASTTQPSTRPDSSASGILESISVDSSPYGGPIGSIKLRTFDNMITKGNLLLLADKSKDAHASFDSASDLARNQKQWLIVIEGVARSIRAESGSIGAANAYIISQR